MVDDGAFAAVIRIDIGNKPVNRFKLRFGIGALPAHMHYFDANRIRIHTVIGNTLRRSFGGPLFVVASIFRHAILAVVTCVAIAGMMGNGVHRHTLHDRSVFIHDELRGHFVATALP